MLWQTINVKNIKVKLKDLSGKQVRDLQLFSPDRVGDKNLPFNLKEVHVILHFRILKSMIWLR